MNSTLIVDLFPGKSASATAVVSRFHFPIFFGDSYSRTRNSRTSLARANIPKNNLIRCILGAGGVSAVELMLEKTGSGTTFTVLSSITFVASGLVWVELRYGTAWRKKRELRLGIDK
jgi:hypothetical protein